MEQVVGGVDRDQAEDVLSVDEAAEAFRVLDETPEEAVQVVLRFP